MPDRRRPRHRLLLELALSTAITGGLVALAEAGARVLGLRAGYFLVPTRANCLQRSVSLGMEFRPNCATTWTDSLLTGEKGTTFETNGLGLRDTALNADGAIRILALGDSCTWGWQVPQDAAYPRVLQRLIDERLGRGRYRVINAGVPGYTSFQGLAYLRERGVALKPQIVIIAFGFNDALPNGDVEQDLERQRRRLALIEVDDWLLTHSALWRWGRTKVRSATKARRPSRAAAEQQRANVPAGPDQPTNRPAPSAERLRVAPDKFKRNLVQMLQLVRESGARPLVLSFADTSELVENPYATAMSQVSRELGVPLVVYEGPVIDIVHPTAEGYERLAGQLLAQMLDIGYVERDARHAATAPGH